MVYYDIIRGRNRSSDTSFWLGPSPQLIIWKMDPALLPEYLLNTKMGSPNLSNHEYPVVFQ
jgi:hypothetical protein